MTITGVDFSSQSGQVSVGFDGSGLTATNPSVISDTTITATYTVASNAPIGSQNLTVRFATADGGAGAPSNPFPVTVDAPPPVPVNFRLTTATDAGNGELDVKYLWDSSTGNLADLSGCTIGEDVTYSAAPGVDYQPPRPPWPSSPYINPTIVTGPATSQGFLDHHSLGKGVTPASFKKPYSASSFVANQFYFYQCNAPEVHLKDGLVITRSISATGSGKWKFVVTSNDTPKTATIDPLP